MRPTKLINSVKAGFNKFKNDLILNFKIYLFARVLESKRKINLIKKFTIKVWKFTKIVKQHIIKIKQ